MRIGQGCDIHRLIHNRKLIVGGVEIPFEKGLLGHSDADVLSHAIADAILGAAALGDIGHHFSDKDDKYKDMSSILILKQCYKLIRDKGLLVSNIDATIISEAPKMQGYILDMRKNISKALNISVDQVNIKATTEEKMGYVGNGEGVRAEAVCLLESFYEASKTVYDSNSTAGGCCCSIRK